MKSESFRIRLGQHTSRGSSQYVPCSDCKCKSIVLYMKMGLNMCIDFDEHHSGGSSFVYVYDILILL